MPSKGKSRGSRARGAGKQGRAQVHAQARSRPAPTRQRGIGDGAVYILFVFLGVCVGFFAWLVAGQSALPWVVGYALAILWLLNMAVVKAYRGGEMAGWQKSLARIPLRPAGYGVRGGKPVEAAHGDPQVRTALITTVCVSLAIAAGGLALMAQSLP
jgi:hypothetical protein